MLALFILILTVSSTEKLEKENTEFFNFNFSTNLQAHFRVFFFLQFLKLYFHFINEACNPFQYKNNQFIIFAGAYAIQPPVSRQGQSCSLTAVPTYAKFLSFSFPYKDKYVLSRLLISPSSPRSAALKNYRYVPFV